MRKREFAVSLFLILAIVFSFVYHKEIAMFFMNRNAITETYTAKNMLTTDTWFESQYQAIEKQKQNLKITEEQLRTVETESLRNSYVAEKKILNELIAEYNAKARAIKYEDFRKRNLPQEIEFYRGER